MITYKIADGSQTYGWTSSGTTIGMDQVNDMVQDADGNIYIVGSVPVYGQGYNIDVLKLGVNLALEWEQTYDGSGLDDIGKGIVVDAAGSVYVTGYTSSTTEGRDIITIKYDANGTQLWEQSYNDDLNYNDEGSEIAIDASANIYITGYLTTAMDTTDFYTIKYDSSGVEQWNIHTDGQAHLIDKASNITIDDNGDIIVTGSSEAEPGKFEYKTVKYVEKEIIIPSDPDTVPSQSNFCYYKNSGQLINTNDSLVPEILYYTNNTSPAYFIKKNSYSFVFAKIHNSDSIVDTLQRIDVNFSKGNSKAVTYPIKEQEAYLNYFLPQCPKGVTEVHGNQRLVTPDIYNNIDLMYSSNQNGIKFYYIIKPGGSPNDIMLEYNGASSFNLDSTTNQLTINSIIGSVSFEQPTVYQLDSANNIIPITGWTADWQAYNDSIYYFNIGAYDDTKSMIIEVDGGIVNQYKVLQEASGLPILATTLMWGCQT